MKPNAIRIAIADDHAMVRQALVGMLNTEESLNVILEADNGKHLLQLLKTITVDIVLLDVRMPVMDGRQALKRIRKAYPAIKVIVFTGFESAGFETEYLNEGALAFLSKSEDIETIINTIHIVSNVSYTSVNEVLTKREREIFNGLIQKQSNKEIAEVLCLSIRTVENHRYSIFRKTSSKTHEELINWAKESRIL